MSARVVVVVTGVGVAVSIVYVTRTSSMSTENRMPAVAQPLIAVIRARKFASLMSAGTHEWPPQAASDEVLPRV